MLYLYLGYLVVQLYSIINVFDKMSTSFSVIFFSIVVFIIWSFAPIVGYLLAKAIGANEILTKKMLFLFGFMVGLIENSLFYFNIISSEQTNIGTFIAFCFFFIIAFIPTKLNVRLK